VNKSLIEAKKLIGEDKDGAEEGGMQLFRAYRGCPRVAL
jgi:hypothetical protein